MNNIERIVQRLRRRLLFVGILESIVPIILGFTVFTIIDSIFILPWIPRLVLVSTVLLLSLAFLIWSILKVPSLSELAWKLEKIYPKMEGRLAVVIDCKDTKTDLGYSLELLKKSEEDALKILKDIDLYRIFKKRVYIALSALLILSLFIYLGWKENTLRRFINPRTPFFSLILDVEPDVVKIGEYSDIDIQTEGITARWVWLTLGEKNIKVKRMRDLPNHYHYKIENLREPISVYASLSDVKTEKRRIEVKIPPVLRDWIFEYTYPAYTGLPPYTQKRGDIYGLAGTSVSFFGKANTELYKVLLINKMNDTTLIRPSGKEFKTKLIISEQDTLNVVLESQSGLLSEGNDLVVNLFPDEYPRIEILYPEQYMDMPRDMEVGIEYKISDDFGVKDVLLTSIFRGESYENRVGSFLPPAIDSFGYYIWDFSDMIILPGDTLQYYLTVYDNDTFNGPKATRSPVYSIRFPLLDELYDELTKESDKISGSVESILERLTDLKKQIERISQSDEISSRDKEAIEELLFEHEELENELAEVSRKTEDLLSKMENTIFLDEEVLEKMRKIDELMKELETDEVKEAREDLMKALNENPQLLEEAFKKFNITEEELKKRLENTLNYLENLQNSQKLQDIIDELKEVKEKQDELREALEAKAEPQKLSSEEGTLNKDMNELAGSLEELSDMMSEMGRELHEATQKAGDIARSMKDVEMSMQMGGTPTSDMEEISDNLSKLSQDLQSLRNMMMGGFSMELKKELRKNQLASISLSTEQEDILNTKEASRFAQREDGIAEAISALKENISNVLSSLMQMDGGVMAMLDVAGDEARKGSEKAKQGEMSEAVQSAKHVMELLNTVTFELFSLEDALKGMAGAMPSLAQFFQNLANLAQAQIGLNQLAQSLFPISIGEGGFSSELRELARSQSEIAKKLRELAQGTEGRILGDLAGVADEMESLASDIEKYGLSEDILKRQEKILKYLLTAQKSIYKERESVRRISKPGKEFPDIVSPEDLRIETNRGVSQRDVLEALKKEYPKEYEKLIRAYFRALSIE